MNKSVVITVHGWPKMFAWLHASHLGCLWNSTKCKKYKKVPARLFKQYYRKEKREKEKEKDIWLELLKFRKLFGDVILKYFAWNIFFNLENFVIRELFIREFVVYEGKILFKNTVTVFLLFQTSVTLHLWKYALIMNTDIQKFGFSNFSRAAY